MIPDRDSSKILPWLIGWETLKQGCHVKIPIQKTTNAKKRPEKSQTLFPVLPFLCHKKHLNYMNIKIFSFESNIKSCLPLCWNTDLPWLFMVCQIARFGQNGTYWSGSSFLHESLSHSLLYLRSKSKEPFYFDVIIAFLPRWCRPVCKALRLFCVYKTIESAHISNDYAKT